jgi:Fic-DOC domain mobile mystery protein B
MGLSPSDSVNITSHTLLNEEDKEGLLIKNITLHSELDEFEQKNIEQAYLWLARKNLDLNTVLSEKFIKTLHRQMLSLVWSWAGHFRIKNTNFGVSWSIISVETKKLIDDCFYWHKQQIFTPTEIALRFKHRLVAIHPFRNGNGRHSRLMADIMMEKVFKQKAFTWGGLSNNDKKQQQEYIRALQAADKGDYEPLIKFATLE